MFDCQTSAHNSNSSCDESELSDKEEESLNDIDTVDIETDETKTPNEPEETKSSKMKDAFISFSLFLFVTVLTHGFGGPSPFVLPAGTQSDEGKPAAAAPPNLRVQFAPPPTPFFGPNSAIDDYYGGDVYAAFSEADLHENALIFYYAPWDADSRLSRPVLEMLADIFADSDLYIGAVNCWTPKGECFKQFGANQSGHKGDKPNVYNPRLPQNQFPILVFYPRDKKGVQYHGPLTVDAILEFLLSARNPVVHLRSKADLLELQARHNGKVMVGYFPDIDSKTQLLGRKSFRSFLSTAFHFLESDPFRVSTGGFGAVTSQKLAMKLHLGPNQPLRYFLWNGTSLAYPNKTISTSESLINWVVAKFGEEEPLTSWIGVVGRKSLSLSRKLLTGSGNSLIVFIPRINRFTFNEALSVVQEASVLYKSCQELNSETEALIQTIRTLRRESGLKADALLHTCRADPWFLKTFENRPFCSTSSSESFCSSATRSNLTIAALNLNAKFSFRRKPILGKPVHDSRVSEVLRMQSRLECTLAHFDSENVKPLSSSACTGNSDLFDVSSRLSGLSCFDNRTLNIFTLDYNSQMGLAKSLGLDERTVQALIVNPARETYYQMKKEFSLENLSTFIEQFHRHPDSLVEAKLSRGHLASNASDRMNATHFSRQISRQNSSFSVLDELSRDAFLSSDRSKPLLLLYVSPSCGFCAAASRAFHSIQNFFKVSKPSDTILNFSTINTSNNDLPWSFTAFSTPSVIFIPSGSDTSQSFHSESRVFPSSKPLNVPNLLSFIVANLPEDFRVHLSNSLSQDQFRQSEDSIESESAKNFDLRSKRHLQSEDNIFQSYHEEL